MTAKPNFEPESEKTDGYLISEQIKYSVKHYDHSSEYYYSLPLSIDINEIKMAFTGLMASQSMQIIDATKSSVTAVSYKSKYNCLNCFLRCFQKKISSIVNVIKFECGFTEEASGNIASLRIMQGTNEILTSFSEQFENKIQSLLPKEDKGKIIKTTDRETLVKDQFLSDEPTQNEYSSYYFFYRMLNDESDAAGKVVV